MYKLGFTTMASVKERFVFQGAGHEDQIDTVIAFVPDTGALLIEQRPGCATSAAASHGQTGAIWQGEMQLLLHGTLPMQPACPCPRVLT